MKNTQEIINNLKKETSPQILVQALATYGLQEADGKENNEVILDWAKTLKIDWYKADSDPWCGLAVGWWAYKAGYPYNSNVLLSARAWARYGDKIDKAEAKLGDILVFERGEKSGHVGLYVGETPATFYVLGGNQGNSVCITEIPKTRLLQVRRTPFKLGVPAGVRKIHYNSLGQLSKNEA